MSDNAKRFIRLPGTARRYLDTVTGKDISDRQRVKIAKEQGLIKRLDIARKANENRYRQEYRSRVASRVKELQSQGITNAAGKPIGKRDVMRDPEFKRLNKEARKSRQVAKKILAKYGDAADFSDLTEKQIAALKKNQESMRAFLKYIGRRNGIPDWVPVGESDSFRRGKIKSPSDLPARWKGIVQ